MIHRGEARLLGTPDGPSCGVQYDAGDRTVVAALSTGRLDGAHARAGAPGPGSVLAAGHRTGGALPGHGDRDVVRRSPSAALRAAVRVECRS
ncbi:hypothetical protein ACRAWF_38450 [Streptomyces sp. L7]